MNPSNLISLKVEDIKSSCIDPEQSSSIRARRIINIDSFPAEVILDLVIRCESRLGSQADLELICLDAKKSIIGKQVLKATEHTIKVTEIRRFSSPQDVIYYELYQKNELVGNCKVTPQFELEIDDPEVLKKIKSIVKPKSKVTFSQYGEDIIVSEILSCMQIDKPTYLDIGAFHPSYLSNTYLMYLNGSRGVCVDPNPSLTHLYRTMRPGDIFLTVGVATNISSLRAVNYYVMSEPSLNTFSKEEAYRIHQMGDYQLSNVVRVPILYINEIIEEYFHSGSPNFLSIDVEGCDLQILNTMDFNRFSPEVISIESLTYGVPEGSIDKFKEITTFMKSNQYSLYAFTGVNCIFVKIGH